MESLHYVSPSERASIRTYLYTYKDVSETLVSIGGDGGGPVHMSPEDFDILAMVWLRQRSFAVVKINSEANLIQAEKKS